MKDYCHPLPASNGLPFITIKYAQTIDGRIATRTGESQWISSDASLTFAHQLRANHDAILVGIGTVLKDNPRLTVRHASGSDPLRVVVDSSLRIPMDANVLAGDAASRTVVGVTRAATEQRIQEITSLGAEVIVCTATPSGLVDLWDLLHKLQSRGVKSVMVEGGARIVTSLLSESLANRLIVCIAPKVLGHGIEGVGDLGIARLPDCIRFSSHVFEAYGEDVMFQGEIEQSNIKPQISGSERNE